jgi:hypothetical protein
MIGTILRFSGGPAVFLFIAFAGAMWMRVPYQPQDAFWLRPLSILIAALAVGKIVRSLPTTLRAARARTEGREASARVEEIEKRRGTSNSGARHLRTRARFSFHVDGTRHEGWTVWGDPHRTSPFAPGAELPIRYLPKDPAHAFWVEDLGGDGRGSRMSQTDYEKLFDETDGRSSPGR